MSADALWGLVTDLVAASGDSGRSVTWFVGPARPFDRSCEWGYASCRARRDLYAVNLTYLPRPVPQAIRAPLFCALARSHGLEPLQVPEMSLLWQQRMTVSGDLPGETAVVWIATSTPVGRLRFPKPLGGMPRTPIRLVAPLSADLAEYISRNLRTISEQPPIALDEVIVVTGVVGYRCRVFSSNGQGVSFEVRTMEEHIPLEVTLGALDVPLSKLSDLLPGDTIVVPMPSRMLCALKIAGEEWGVAEVSVGEKGLEMRLVNLPCRAESALLAP